MTITFGDIVDHVVAPAVDPLILNRSELDALTEAVLEVAPLSSWRLTAALVYESGELTPDGFWKIVDDFDTPIVEWSRSTSVASIDEATFRWRGMEFYEAIVASEDEAPYREVEDGFIAMCGGRITRDDLKAVSFF